MSRVIILGMDGLDPDLLEKWWDELPNFRRLRDQGMYARFDSVYPPDSVPAWASIYTGMSPDHHGILDSVDYLDIARKNLNCDTAVLRDNTFWDEAGRNGKRVCIINPFLAYPVWPVNGIMVNGPVFVSGEVQAYPESVLSDYDVPELGGIVDSPTKKTLGEFAARAKALAYSHLEFGKALFKAEDWDLFFINFLTLDRIQHFFWRYLDTDDPTYPGPTEHADVIKGFYLLHDELIGEFLKLSAEDQTVIVLSDHGHGRRCTKSVFINEFLRRKGLLKAGTPMGKLDPKYILERTKVQALKTLDKYDLQDWSYRIGRMIPGAKSLKKSTFVIDKAGSKAGVARFSGMNPYGGIDLPRSAFDMGDADYDALVRGLMDDLMKLKDPETGEPVVKWVRHREEMFSGPYADIYPEIIFQLGFDYGVSRSLFGPLVDINPTHKKISGGHMPQAVFLADKELSSFSSVKHNVVAIASVVLGLLGVTVPERMNLPSGVEGSP